MPQLHRTAVTLGRIAALTACLAAVITGAAQAFSTRVLFRPSGDSGNQNLGTSVASAGDMNGDGYPEVIVGTMFANRAAVYFGGPAADSIPDLPLTGFNPSDQFGKSVSSAGDVNRDGYADVVIGASQAPNGVGAGLAYILFGGASPDATPDVTLSGQQTGDSFGWSVAGVGDVNGDGFSDVLVGAYRNFAGGTEAGRAYLYYGGASMDAVADLTMTGDAAYGSFGRTVAAAGDMNRDGYADFAVAAPQYDYGGSSTVDYGRIYVYFGGPTLDSTPDLVIDGSAYGELAGLSLSSGDVNGDGYSDLIIGGYEYDFYNFDEGRVRIVYGGPGIDAAPDLQMIGHGDNQWLGYSVTSADLDGDGVADVIAGQGVQLGPGQVVLYRGSAVPDTTADLTLAGAVPYDYYGYSVASGGDVDGDGRTDLIVGAPGAAVGAIGGAGRAYVISVFPYQVLSPNGGEAWVSGRPATVRWRGHDPADLAMSLDGGLTWNTIASGVGGQEMNELSVIAPTVVTSGARIRLTYSGQSPTRATSDMSDQPFRIVAQTSPPTVASVQQITPTGAAASDAFATSLAPAGDVNGDGYGDVIVGAPGNDAGGSSAGRAYIYFGGPASDAVADVTLTGAAAGDGLGISVGGAGDVNGDGYADVIVGASANDAGGTDAGRAYVYYGGPAMDAVADLTLTGAAASDAFGYCVAGAGDVNGDRYADVIVGARGNDFFAVDAGRAYVFYGGVTPDATADLTLTGAAAGDFFGFSVAGAGDVNRDGYADLLVGAFKNDAAGADAGRAYLYYGGRTPDAIADLVLTGAAAGDNFGYAVAGAGDVNGDGSSDLIVGAYLNDAGGTNAGRVYLYHGGLELDATADQTFTGAAGDALGFSLSGAGDVNADGFADVVAGGLLNDAGGTDAGRCYVYLGGPATDASADITITGAAAGDILGWACSGAGDVNGDGFADLLLGAQGNDAGGSNAGRAYVRPCSRYVVVSPNDDEVWNVGASQSITWLGSERADLWLSVDAGRTYDLLRHDVGGAETNTLNLLAPHAPTKFARIKVTPANTAIRGADESDSTFTIQSSVALLNFVVAPTEDGAELSWSTDPGVGPDGLAGYRLYRSRTGDGGNGVRVGPELLAESRYTDREGSPGTSYRLVAVNGLHEELELGRVELAPMAPLAAWPMPYRGGALSCSFGVSGEFGSAAGEAVVEVYDLGGRRVKTIAHGRFQAGYRTVRWDGRDESGTPVRSGIYFLSARSGGASHQLKLVVTR